MSPSCEAAVTAESGALLGRVYRHVRVIAPFSLGWLLTCVLSGIAVVYRQPIVGAITVGLSTVLLVASTVVVALNWWRRARPAGQARLIRPPGVGIAVRMITVRSGSRRPTIKWRSPEGNTQRAAAWQGYSGHRLRQELI